MERVECSVGSAVLLCELGNPFRSNLEVQNSVGQQTAASDCSTVRCVPCVPCVCTMCTLCVYCVYCVYHLCVLCLSVCVPLFFLFVVVFRFRC